ncbi:MAG: glycosyltransferase, partial [Xanthomonadales bacterium]|nr:glycosyltransferase [Xanthomonadales bacterium]
MRVLHVGKFWPPYAGGIERAMHGLCAGLAAEGQQVDVLAHADPGQWRGQTFSDHGIGVHLVGCAGQVAYTPMSPSFAPTLARLLRQRQPQLLHLHMPNPAVFWALLLPSARRLPWVVHWHADIPLREAPLAVRMAYPFYQPWQRALLTRAHRIIATSPHYRDASVPLAPWRDKTRVIPLSLAA